MKKPNRTAGLFKLRDFPWFLQKNHCKKLRWRTSFGLIEGKRGNLAPVMVPMMMTGKCVSRGSNGANQDEHGDGGENQTAEFHGAIDLSIHKHLGCPWMAKNSPKNSLSASGK